MKSLLLYLANRFLIQLILQITRAVCSLPTRAQGTAVGSTRSAPGRSFSEPSGRPRVRHVRENPMKAAIISPTGLGAARDFRKRPDRDRTCLSSF